MAKQKLIILAGGAVFLALVGGWVFYMILSAKPVPAPQSSVPTGAESITESSAEGVVDIDANPLKDAPDVNPVVKANPYSNVKTNPFE